MTVWKTTYLTCWILALGSVEAGDHGAAIWDSLLVKYVSEDGVDYQAWSMSEEDREGLDGYLGLLAELPLETLAEAEQKAVLINVY
ncbi:MAG: hypothetical protein AAF191_19730, partial [Verrucomicrobiota bacterium]